MIRIFRMVVLAFVVAAIPVGVAGVAQADPAECVEYVLGQDYEATPAVLRACRIAATGEPEDERQCVRIMTDEDIDAATARAACRIASS